MNFELISLDTWINAFIGNKTELPGEAELLEEGERILIVLKIEVISARPDSVTRYIRLHQYSLLGLMNKLSGHCNMPADQVSDERVMQILKLLERIIEDIQVFFPDQFDFQAILPSHLFLKGIKSITSRWMDAKSLLKGSGYSNEFIAELTKLVVPEEKHNGKLSFAELNYLDKLPELLKAWTHQERTNDVFEFMMMLVSANFNAPDFHNYCTDFISKELSATHSMHSRLEILNYFKKRFAQEVYSSPGRYQQSLPPIRDSLLQFVNSEIDYLKNISVLEEGSATENKHFKVALTVRQLAIFINLQAACGIIASDKPKAIHEYVTAHYNTTDQSNISEKSFKNAYYGNTAADLDKVLEKITQMLVIGQKKYSNKPVVPGCF